ncbi:hypothetical protein [Cohnella yongneupensis]|uniref:VCBS repeat-containing protein n=1 Tax=Cohnella yongneupensis TaxID=425006 RepID=A0ABW0R302_9BACL
MKRWLIAMLAITALFTVITEPAMAAGKATQTAYTAFRQTLKLPANAPLKSLNADMNNDGVSDIVLLNTSGRVYLGVYRPDNGKLISLAKVGEGGDEAIDYHEEYTLRTIKNPLFKIGAAVVINVYTGNSAFVTVKLYALKSGKLVQAGTADGAGQNVEIADTNKDGYQEITTWEEYSYNPDTDNLSRADSIYDRVVTQWDTKQGKYVSVVYGQDGKRDDQRPKVGTLTAPQALTILANAYKLQTSFEKARSDESYTLAMASLFTFNYIFEFKQSLLYDSDGGFGKKGGYIPAYSISDDYSDLMPRFNLKQSATFKLSADKQFAALSQKVTLSGEEGTYTINAYAEFCKTKYGWKVNAAYAN